MGWSSIKNFSSSPIIKVSYLVVVGLPIVLEILAHRGLLKPLPHSLFIVFWSGIALLASAGLYSFFAPREIKQFHRMEEFVDEQEKLLNKKDIDAKRSNVITYLDKQTQKEQIEKLRMMTRTWMEEANSDQKDSLKRQLDAYVMELYPSTVITYLHTRWRKIDRWGNWLALWLCYGFLSIGSGLAVWMFYERIKIVVENTPQL